MIVTLGALMTYDSNTCFNIIFHAYTKIDTKLTYPFTERDVIFIIIFQFFVLTHF